MERDRWSRGEQVFHAALQLNAEERAAFVREVCDEDFELCGEVLSLIDSYQKSCSWVIPPAATRLDDAEEASLQGQRLGSYRIEREIGQGGMGAVFLASRADDQYQKNVAIKLVRISLLTAFLANRFRKERQILAALEHPYIARLLDGGITPDGQPFLVMEYVEGVPVDVYCDMHELSTGDRLRLFRKICEAVHYAHQRLVIHRDLKPSNILVTAQGEPKLLDFGVAKLIDRDGASGETTEVLLATPQYASPELVNGQAVTTATDVYSLGVILYRLLTGCSPYGGAVSGMDLIQAILNGDIVKPDAAQARKRRISGDLASITLKALRKEPERRYASAEQLSEDVRRHLESLPVMAGSESFRYLAAKFIRRNRTAVAAIAMAAVSLIGATVVSLHQSRIASQERRLAEIRLERLRGLTGSLLFEFHDAIQTLPGATQARKLLTQRALEYLNSLDPSTARDPGQRAQMVEAYRKIGDVQGNPSNANLGDTAGALASYAKALAIAQEMVKANPGDNGSRRTLAVLLEKIADTRAQTGEIERAVEESRQSLAMFLDLAERDSSLEARQQAGTAHIKLADLLGHPSFPNIGDRSGAFAHYQEALKIYSGLKPPENPVTRRYLGVIYERIGKMLELAGRKSEALASYQKSFAIREALSSAYPADTNARRDLAIAHEKIGDLLVGSRQTRKGLKQLQEALKILESLHTLDPFNANAARAVGIEYEKIAHAFTLDGDAVNARLFSGKARAVFERLASSDPMNARARADLERVSGHP